jgi:formiminotetrahydrofolate cyclodeaminase
MGVFLDEVRTAPPGPAGGSVACVAVAMAAALLEMAARRSLAGFDESDGAAAQAAYLRRGAMRLAQQDAEAFQHAESTLENPAGDDQEARDASIASALDRASAVPLQIARVAADVVDLGTVVAGLTPDDRRPDVTTAVLLAEAACAAAAHLVEVNLATTPADERLARARDATRRAQRAAAGGTEMIRSR